MSEKQTKVSPTLPPLRPTTAMRESVQTFLPPDVTPRMTIFQIASHADEAPPWWSPDRDYYLDNFWPTEPYLSGCIFSVASRNASYRYELTGHRRKVAWAQQLFAQSDFGLGWHDLMMKLTQDYLVCGNGGWIEIIRPARALTKSGTSYYAIRDYHPETGEMAWFAYDDHSGKINYHWKQGDDFTITDDPLDLPVGIAHKDSLRMTRTNDPAYPAIYRDQFGRDHLMSMHQIMSFEEMPSPREEMNRVQHSAVDRSLILAQTLRDMLTYKHEKISGRFARAIHLTNIDADTIQDAVDQANENADNKGLMRYSQPIIAATLDPNAQPRVDTIELASLPDGFDEETAMRWYVAGLAMDFGVDFGFLAPLPGNKLGTSEQAEQAARQAKGKSSRLFLNLMEYKFNFSGILPRDVYFRFAVPDPYEESERDRALARRARSLSTLIQSQIITPEIGAQLLADWGDLDPQYLAQMGLGDLTPIVTVGGAEPVPPALPRHFVPAVQRQLQQRVEAEDKPQLGAGGGE